jgi:hypothetical protein
MQYYNRYNTDIVFRDSRQYRKKVLVRAVRITGSFRVRTREGLLECQDGYLCWDSSGYPYPVARDEFEAIYELV